MDHGSLVRVDLNLAVPAVLARRVVIAVRDGRGGQLAPTRLVQPTPATALQDLGPFVFGDRPLDLQQQLVVRRVVDRPLAEVDLDSRLLQLLQQQHLIGIGGRTAPG
jgi:hypothetical protein